MQEPELPQHPYRPVLTVRVGIAGHRWNKLKRQNAEGVQQRFDLVFASIEAVVDEILRDEERCFGYRSARPGAPEPADPNLRVLSGLAEGTDRLGVLVARSRKRAWQLTALLPFARERYELDFKRRKVLADGTEVSLEQGEPGYGELDPDSVQEFRDLLLAAELEGGVQELDGAAGKPGAYRPLATAICLNSDVIVVVWDEAEAKPGGTGDIVHLAGELGIPVVCIPPDGVGNPWLHDPDAGKGRRDGVHSLAEHLRRLLVAPRHLADKAAKRRDLREKYFAERARRVTVGSLYDWVFRLLAGGPRRTPSTAAPDRNFVRALAQRWEREWTALGACGEVVRELLKTRIHAHYAWASHLANYYGGLYRTAFLANYTLAWLAVAAAAVGVAFSELALPAEIAEVVLLSAIVTIVLIGSRRRLHARWIDYRRLAEWIRLLPMLLPLSRTPVLGVDANPVLASQESWVDWMCRAVVREAGVLALDLSKHVRGARGILGDGVLRGQIAYHERTAAQNRRLNELLHLSTVAIFVVALALAVLHLTDLLRESRHLGPLLPESLKGAVLVAALVLPALGGALHGLNSQGEYEVTATRSESVKERLEELQRELGTLPRLSVEGIAEIAVKTATTMNAELSSWLLTYQRKGIPIP